jgi:arylsulfatase A-like enzyme
VASALDEAGLSDSTILVLTSDHYGMIGSQGIGKKPIPRKAAVRVPLLRRYPPILSSDQR